jgi:4-azaleucine resistance transporter AzlC
VVAGRRQEFARGLAKSVPILVGSIPTGIAYGVLARQSGLSGIETVAMSVLVFAGSAQFVAIAMLSAGASAAAMVVATFFINLRHVLFGASLAKWLDEVPVAWRAALAHGLTDETYALNAILFTQGEGSRWTMLATNIAMYVNWLAASAVGAFAGVWLGDVRRFGAEFAIPAMFIALATLMIKDRVHVAAAAVAAVAAVLFRVTLGPDWYVVGMVVAGASAGVVIERWLERS